MSAFNLPPSVSLKDIDPPVCVTCQGHGEVCFEGRIKHRGAVKDCEEWVQCPDCDGLGVPNDPEPKE